MLHTLIIVLVILLIAVFVLAAIVMAYEFVQIMRLRKRIKRQIELMQMYGRSKNK